MRKLVRILACAAATSTLVPISRAQDAGAPQHKEGAQDTFFSGNVVSLTVDKLTVTRRTLALSSVTKTFLLDSETKIEGNLQVKARVTVKFEKTEDGERAVRVIVR